MPCIWYNIIEKQLQRFLVIKDESKSLLPEPEQTRGDAALGTSGTAIPSPGEKVAERSEVGSGMRAGSYR